MFMTTEELIRYWLWRVKQHHYTLGPFIRTTPRKWRRYLAV